MGGAAPALGRAVQVDPIKPELDPPGTKRLKRDHDELLSCFAFKFHLRRYNSALSAEEQDRQGRTLVHFSAQPEPFLTQNIPPNTQIHPMTPPKQPLNNPYTPPRQPLNSP